MLEILARSRIRRVVLRNASRMFTLETTIWSYELIGRVIRYNKD